jgi:TRAP-type C4-dicarboxylate transport system substrate-binding protein
MYEAELADKFPAEVAGIAAANEAAEIVRTALKTANKAVANELLASGTTIAEPAAPAEPAKAWA